MGNGRSSSEGAGEDAGESSDQGNSLEPGGGPKRIVSNSSVDDILDSLNDTSADGDDGPPAETRSDVDSRDSSADSDLDDRVETPPTGEERETAESTESDESDDSKTDPTDADGADEDPAGTDDSQPLNSESTSDASSIDDRAAALGDANSADDETGSDVDAAADALAARIDQGAVTGADVRAAEAGDGREETPEIDEIDLSMDDLEATQSTTGAAPGTGGDEFDADAGPLAGSIEKDASDSIDDEDVDGGDESPGLLGRLKGFFSG